MLEHDTDEFLKPVLPCLTGLPLVLRVYPWIRVPSESDLEEGPSIVDGGRAHLESWELPVDYFLNELIAGRLRGTNTFRPQSRPAKTRAPLKWPACSRRMTARPEKIPETGPPIARNNASAPRRRAWNSRPASRTVGVGKQSPAATRRPKNDARAGGRKADLRQAHVSEIESGRSNCATTIKMRGQRQSG